MKKFTSGSQCTTYIQVISVERNEGKRHQMKEHVDFSQVTSVRVIADSRETFNGSHALASFWLYTK